MTKLLGDEQDGAKAGAADIGDTLEIHDYGAVVFADNALYRIFEIRSGSTVDTAVNLHDQGPILFLSLDFHAWFRRAVSKGMELAVQAEEYVRESPVLEMLTPVSLGVVCFRVNPADASLDEDALGELNKTMLARIFWDDKAFVSSTLLKGKFALRFCIINHTTAWDDVRETLEAIERFGRDELQKQG